MKIIITGSSFGIGRALTEYLLKKGHLVWGIARSNQHELEALYPNKFISSSCDVSDWKQINQTAHKVSAAWTTVNALITCAGIHGELGRAVSIDPIKWEKTVISNLSGTYFSIRAFHPLISSSPNRGKIICFSGGGATKARPQFSAYGAAKTAIVRLVETISLEENNLDINSIAPGSINTRLIDEILRLGPTITGAAEHSAAILQKKEGGQSLTKVIDLIEWLLSESSNGISGKLLSAQWDPWQKLNINKQNLTQSDIYNLRRILPEDRATTF
jgi:NAD(P)-dependent dehydrogenase (short-subunit alcohol dehydrogenase family)